ncbi:MAG TPA: crossover junction endodeoxyribonuclease RuvC [Planctomycetota bacterium]|nr:crossover junction endodeoxyribonuclease RuvC [Planctomycetota bacterium]
MPALRWIVGCDPGTAEAGIAILEEDIETRSGLRLVDHEHICVEGSRAFRLYWIHERLTKIFQRLKETDPGRRMDVAVEFMFAGARNPKTSMVMGEARGIILAAAGAVPKVRIFDYSPSAMKKAIADHGFAQKAQVAAAVSLKLNLPELLPLDVADAAGLAILHSMRT